jgi:hypothetical protein
MEESDRITKSLANSILSHDADAQSKIITLLASDIFGEIQEDRSFIPDVKFKNEKDHRFVIEMQTVDDGS